jgi:hypothetical protein
MNRFFKTLVLWFLLVAFPVQGMAAAIQLSCGPAHHAIMVSDAQQLHAHSHGVAPHHHGDEVGAQQTSSDTHADTMAKADKMPDAKQAASSCSACASCCTGATAPPAFSTWSSPHSSSELVVIYPSPSVTGFVPAGLERPPKRISA